MTTLLICQKCQSVNFDLKEILGPELSRIVVPDKSEKENP